MLYLIFYPFPTGVRRAAQLAPLRPRPDLRLSRCRPCPSANCFAEWLQGIAFRSVPAGTVAAALSLRSRYRTPAIFTFFHHGRNQGLETLPLHRLQALPSTPFRAAPSGSVSARPQRLRCRSALAAGSPNQGQCFPHPFPILWDKASPGSYSLCGFLSLARVRASLTCSASSATALLGLCALRFRSSSLGRFTSLRSSGPAPMLRAWRRL